MSPTKSTAFLQQVFSVLLDYIRESNDRKSLVVDFHHPQELRQLIGHMLEVGSGDPLEPDKILDDCRVALHYCVRTGRLMLT